MTDRELLELSAKAAGYIIQGDVDRMVVQPGHYEGGLIVESESGGSMLWHPLTDDGDALRLSVKLNLAVQTLPGRDKPASEAWHNDKYARERWCDCGDDPYAATRRAIVRAAAEIGKTP